MSKLAHMTGHRVVIQADLKCTEDGGPKGSLLAGHYSTPCQFDGLGGEPDQVFTTTFESVHEGGEPGSRMIATIRFIHELAEVYATPGAVVRLIQGSVVGNGVVLKILPRSRRVDKVKVRYHIVGRTPSISANVRDVDGMDLLSIGVDLFAGRNFSWLKKARGSGDHWSCWGEVLYLVGTNGLVHLSMSPHDYEDLENFATITEAQFDQILADFEQFKSDRIDFEREY